MFAISATAVSGMNAAQSRMQASAQSIARLGTQGLEPQAATQAAAGAVGSSAWTPSTAPASSLETDLVGLLQAKNAFLANLAVFRTSDQVAGTLLDLAG